jgi:hypothetical protein
MKTLIKFTFCALVFACIVVIATGGDPTAFIIAYDVLVFTALVLVFYLLYSDDVSFLIERGNDVD